MTTIEIATFLECSVCLDFPASPIHSCANAHILCGQCAPKLSACPTCKLPKLSPSPICEKLAKEAGKKMWCPNREAGCKEQVLSTKFPEHLSLCQFREIRCNYKGICGVTVRFQDYLKHLEDAHRPKSNGGPKLTRIYHHFERRLPLSEKAYDWLQWGETVVKFSDHHFFLHARVANKSQIFFAWVSVLGDKDLAKKYACEVKLHNAKSNKVGCSWALQVLGFHEIPTNYLLEGQLFGFSEESGVLAVPMGAIRKWGETYNNEFSRFKVTCEIKEA